MGFREWWFIGMEFSCDLLGVHSDLMGFTDFMGFNCDLLGF
jgi:hypothetical protein